MLLLCVIVSSFTVGYTRDIVPLRVALDDLTSKEIITYTGASVVEVVSSYLTFPCLSFHLIRRIQHIFLRVYH